MRKFITIGAAAAALAIVPTIAVASSSSSSAPAASSRDLYSGINCHDLVWRTTSVSTSSSSYSSLAGLATRVISAGGMVVSVSIVMHGPAQRAPPRTVIASVTSKTVMAA